MAINNAPLEGTKFSPYELNLGYCPCLATDAFWEATDRPGQSQPAKLWMKQIETEWKNAHLALQSIKDKQMSRANRHHHNYKLQCGGCVMAWMFLVNRKQLNQEGPYANR